MDIKIQQAILDAVSKEPLAIKFDMQLVHLEAGRSVVEMVYLPEMMDNIFKRAHGGAIFALIDEAFETAAQTEGTIAVAMNINVNYVSSPTSGATLQAEANRISQTKRTTGFQIQVVEKDGPLIATCQALAYQTGKPLPFL